MRARFCHLKHLIAILGLALLAGPALAATAPVTGDSAAAAALPGIVPVGQVGSLPWSVPPWLMLLPALLAVAIGWAGRAWWHAWVTEPMRQRRQGARALHRLLAEIADQAMLSPAQWHRLRRAVTQAWAIADAAPTGRAVVTAGGPPEVAALWQKLWQDSERALFAASPALPDHWASELASAVGQTPLPERQQPYPTGLHHWFPQLGMAAMLVIALIPALSQAKDPPASAQTPAAWQQALEADGRDWAAHRNLATRQLTDGRPDLAMAHATAAFLLNGDEGSRQLLQQTLQQVTFAAAPLKAIFVQRQWAGIPAWLTPVGWQRLAVIAAALLVGGGWLVVTGLYRSRSWPWIAGGGSLAGVSLMLLVFAQLGFSAYGTLACADAALVLQGTNVFPEPTDLVPEEDTAPLAVGAVVHVRGRFLGWTQVQPEGKAGGWVRSMAVMRVYGARPDSGA